MPLVMFCASDFTGVNCFALYGDYSSTLVNDLQVRNHGIWVTTLGVPHVMSTSDGVNLRAFVCPSSLKLILC